jgi:hypothetical protein
MKLTFKDGPGLDTGLPIAGDVIAVEVDAADALGPTSLVDGDVVVDRVNTSSAWRVLLPLPPFLLPVLGVSPSLPDRVSTSRPVLLPFLPFKFFFLPTLTVSAVATDNDVIFRGDGDAMKTGDIGRGVAWGIIETGGLRGGYVQGKFSCNHRTRQCRGVQCFNGIVCGG